MSHEHATSPFQPKPTRRQFLAATGGALLAAAVRDLPLPGAQAAPIGNERPNILILMSDQLAQRGIGAYGGAFSRTPNLDALARRGVRFSRNYTTCPLCMPMRASLWTGRMPHEVGVLSNKGPGRVPEDVPTLGALFTEAGYETAYFGKTHDAGALRGFSVVPPIERSSRRYRAGSRSWRLPGTAAHGAR